MIALLAPGGGLIAGLAVGGVCLRLALLRLPLAVRRLLVALIAPCRGLVTRLTATLGLARAFRLGAILLAARRALLLAILSLPVLRIRLLGGATGRGRGLLLTLRRIFLIRLRRRLLRRFGLLSERRHRLRGVRP